MEAFQAGCPDTGVQKRISELLQDLGCKGSVVCVYDVKHPPQGLVHARQMLYH